MKTKIPSQNRLYQERKNKIQGLFIFAFLTLYLLSQLSGIYLKWIKGLIKKKNKKINNKRQLKNKEKNKLDNSMTLVGLGAAEERGKGEEERKREEREGKRERRGGDGQESCSQFGASRWLLGVGGGGVYGEDMKEKGDNEKDEWEEQG